MVSNLSKSLEQAQTKRDCGGYSIRSKPVNFTNALLGNHSLSLEQHAV